MTSSANQSWFSLCCNCMCLRFTVLDGHIISLLVLLSSWCQILAWNICQFQYWLSTVTLADTNRKIMCACMTSFALFNPTEKAVSVMSRHSLELIRFNGVFNSLRMMAESTDTNLSFFWSKKSPLDYQSCVTLK